MSSMPMKDHSSGNGKKGRRRIKRRSWEGKEKCFLSFVSNLKGGVNISLRSRTESTYNIIINQ